jgi:hypothetical protein
MDNIGSSGRHSDATVPSVRATTMTPIMTLTCNNDDADRGPPS